MKITVVGAGAMGSLFGALLAEAGNDVWLFDVRADHVHTVDNHGLVVERDGHSRTVGIRATCDPARINPADLVIIFVKSNATSSAAQTARQLTGSGGAVMTLQNGMGNADTIAEVTASSRILAGTTAHGATLLGPGRIHHAGNGPTIIGAWKNTAQGRQVARRMVDLFNASGIATRVDDDILSVIWNKLLINIGINAITALTAIPNGRLLDLDITRELSRTAVEEAVRVARAQKIRIREDAVAAVFEVAEATAANRSSMGQDVDNRRPTEISAINGFIVRESKRLGMAAPVNFALTALVETLQHHYPAQFKDNPTQPKDDIHERQEGDDTRCAGGQGGKSQADHVDGV